MSARIALFCYQLAVQPALPLFSHHLASCRHLSIFRFPFPLFFSSTLREVMQASSVREEM